MSHDVYIVKIGPPVRPVTHVRDVETKKKERKKVKEGKEDTEGNLIGYSLRPSTSSERNMFAWWVVFGAGRGLFRGSSLIRSSFRDVGDGNLPFLSALVVGLYDSLYCRTNRDNDINDDDDIDDGAA